MRDLGFESDPSTYVRKAPPITAFCHIVKASGTTVTTLFRRNFGIRHLDAYPRRDGEIYTSTELARDLRLMPWLRVISGHGLRPYVDYGQVGRRLRWITWLRDPVKRVISGFQHAVERRGYTRSFEAWLREPAHRNRMVYFLTGSEDDVAGAQALVRDRMVFVGLVERFDESLLMMRDALGMPEFDLDYPQPANQARSGDTARRVWDDRARYAELLHWNTAHDKALYDWFVAEVFPTRLARYGIDRLGRDREKVFERRSPRLPQRVREMATNAFRVGLYRPLLSRLSAPG